MFARLNDGNKAYQSFKEFIEKSTSRIGLDLHPPFQIDGNFGIASAISEMFIREENNIIILLPAISDIGLKNGFFDGVLLHNNLVLSFKWEKNKIIFIQFENKGEKARDLNLICFKTKINLPKVIQIEANSFLKLE